jgi:hypothetical protein
MTMHCDNMPTKLCITVLAHYFMMLLHYGTIYLVAILKCIVLMCDCIGVDELIVIRCSSFETFLDLWPPTPGPRP